MLIDALYESLDKCVRQKKRLEIFQIKHVCSFIQERIGVGGECAQESCSETDAFRLLLQMVLFAKHSAILQPICRLFALVVMQSAHQLEEFLLLGKTIVTLLSACADHQHSSGPSLSLKGWSLRLPFVDPDVPVTPTKYALRVDSLADALELQSFWCSVLSKLYREYIERDLCSSFITISAVVLSDVAVAEVTCQMMSHCAISELAPAFVEAVCSAIDDIINHSYHSPGSRYVLATMLSNGLMGSLIAWIESAMMPLVQGVQDAHSRVVSVDSNEKMKTAIIMCCTLLIKLVSDERTAASSFDKNTSESIPGLYIAAALSATTRMMVRTSDELERWLQSNFAANMRIGDRNSAGNVNSVDSGLSSILFTNGNTFRCSSGIGAAIGDDAERAARVAALSEALCMLIDTFCRVAGTAMALASSGLVSIRIDALKGGLGAMMNFCVDVRTHHFISCAFVHLLSQSPAAYQKLAVALDRATAPAHETAPAEAAQKRRRLESAGSSSLLDTTCERLAKDITTGAAVHESPTVTRRTRTTCAPSVCSQSLLLHHVIAEEGGFAEPVATVFTDILFSIFNSLCERNRHPDSQQHRPSAAWPWSSSSSSSSSWTQLLQVHLYSIRC